MGLTRGDTLLVGANRVLTAVGWAAYPLLLAAAVISPAASAASAASTAAASAAAAPHEALPLLAVLVLVPAAGFLICTAIRSAVDAPRPYEQSGAEPLIHKDTRGKSFPSRHVFSMTTIALSWLYLGLFWSPALVVGALLLASSIFMAWVRVRAGVHYARDVVAGAVLALAVCLVGYALPILPNLVSP